jgi:hypothetical protein
MFVKNERFFLSLFNLKFICFSSSDDFKPASVIKSDQAELIVGENQDVTITIPNVEVKKR